MADVSTPTDSPRSTENRSPESGEARIYTWAYADGSRIEQARVADSGEGLRVRGNLVEAPTDDRPALTLGYVVELADGYRISRVAFESITAAGERTLELKHDGEGAWIAEGPEGAVERVGATGARSVLIDASMLLFSLAVRANDLHSNQDEVDEPALSVDPYTLGVSETSMSFRSDDTMVHGVTGVAATSAHVDADGFVVDVPSLLSRS